jgi:hypothetical protein
MSTIILSDTTRNYKILLMTIRLHPRVAPREDSLMTNMVSVINLSAYPSRKGCGKYEGCEVHMPVPGFPQRGSPSQDAMGYTV